MPADRQPSQHGSPSAKDYYFGPFRRAADQVKGVSQQWQDQQPQPPAPHTDSTQTPGSGEHGEAGWQQQTTQQSDPSRSASWSTGPQNPAAQQIGDGWYGEGQMPEQGSTQPQAGQQMQQQPQTVQYEQQSNQYQQGYHQPAAPTATQAEAPQQPPYRFFRVASLIVIVLLAAILILLIVDNAIIDHVIRNTNSGS